MVQAGSLASILRKDVPLFSDDIREEWTGSTGKYGAVMSQYGWQWESRFLDGGDVVGERPSLLLGRRWEGRPGVSGMAMVSFEGGSRMRWPGA